MFSDYNLLSKFTALVLLLFVEAYVSSFELNTHIGETWPNAGHGRDLSLTETR